MSRGVVGRLKGGQLEFEWDIPDFLSLTAEEDQWYDSPEYSFGDTSWYIRVYPNGYCSPGCIDMSVVRGDSGPPVTATCGLFLKTTDGRKKVWSEEKKSFSGRDDNVGFFSRLSWLLVTVLSRSELIRRESELLPSGVLTVMCTLEFDAERGIEAEPRTVKESAELVEASTQTQSEYSEPRTVRESAESVEASTQTQSECYTDKLSHDLSELLLSREDTDLTVKVKGVEFRLHRLIMGARTPVFSAMLRHDMTEKATGLVSVEDCEPEVFQAFVRYVYSGNVDEPSTDTAFGLFALADKYQVEELKTTCYEFIQRSLSADTFCDVVKLALTYDKKELLERAAEYFAERMEDILQTVKWMNFMREHYIQANELLLKAARVNKSK